jgi:DNA polymerase III sliding clamp (beta) subunit (PCNA family)
VFRVFVVERLPLLTALTTVQALAGPATVASVSADEEGGVVVAAGTAERGARASTMAARTLLPGALTVPLKPLIRLLGCSSGSKCEVAFNGKSVAIAVDADGPGPRRYTFASEGGAEITDRPPVDRDALTVELASSAFETLVARTGFLTARRSADSSGWATDAVELRAADGRLTARATDTFRLATASTAIELPARRTATFLVSEGVLKAWLRPVRETESVRLTFGAHLVLRAGTFAAWTSLHAGTFPDATAVPDELPHALDVPTEPLRAAVGSALALVDSADPQVTLTTRRGALVVSASLGASRCESVVPTPGCDGPPLSITINGSRLLGTLRAYSDAPTVRLGYTSGDEPIEISVADCKTLLAPHRYRDQQPAKKPRAVGQAAS